VQNGLARKAEAFVSVVATACPFGKRLLLARFSFINLPIYWAPDVV